MSKIPGKNSQSAFPLKMFRSKLQHVSVSCTHLMALTAEGLYLIICLKFKKKTLSLQFLQKCLDPSCSTCQ